jgi:hypothetical protein
MSINGHSISELRRVLLQEGFDEPVRQVVIANTLKGKGVSFVEGSVHWHYKVALDLRPRESNLGNHRVMRAVLAELLEDLLITDPSVILVTGHLGYGVLDQIPETRPQQSLNE